MTNASLSRLADKAGGARALKANAEQTLAECKTVFINENVAIAEGKLFRVVMSDVEGTGVDWKHVVEGMIPKLTPAQKRFLKRLIAEHTTETVGVTMRVHSRKGVK